VRLHVYTFTHNERRLAPFFLRHYKPNLGVERIVVHDNESTDGTPQLLRQDPRVSRCHIQSSPDCSFPTCIVPMPPIAWNGLMKR
jgi:hypothetical protein